MVPNEDLLGKRSHPQSPKPSPNPETFQFDDLLGKTNFQTDRGAKQVQKKENWENGKRETSQNMELLKSAEQIAPRREIQNPKSKIQAPAILAADFTSGQPCRNNWLAQNVVFPRKPRRSIFGMTNAILLICTCICQFWQPPRPLRR
jgi:hypothetical protein